MPIQFPAKADFVIGQGRTLPLLEATLLDGQGRVIALDGVVTDVRFYMSPENVAEGTTATVNGVACTILSDVAFTADSSTDILTAAGHGLVDESPVMVSSTGSLPGGLDAFTLYYVINATTNTFQLSATANGSSVNLTTNGTGTHTCVRGRIRYAWSTSDTVDKGNFWGKFKVTYPDDTTLDVPSDDQHPFLFIRITQKLG